MIDNNKVPLNPDPISRKQRRSKRARFVSSPTGIGF